MLDETTIGISPQQKTLANPHARLFLKRNSIGPKVINTIIHIKNLLQLKGIFEDEIEEVLLSESDERLKDICEKSGKTELDFPVIFIQDVYIGTVDDLEDWVVSDKLDNLLEKTYRVMRPRSESQVERETKAMEKHLHNIQQQKLLLETEMQKAVEQENDGAMEELKTSILLLDKDINSLTRILTKQEQKRKSLDISASKSASIPVDNNSGSFLGSSPPLKSSSLPVKSSPPPSQTVVNTESGGIMGYAFTTGKSLLGSVGSAISTYIPWSSTTADHPSSSSLLSTSPPKDYKISSQYIEFEVMQINWYWRQQKRILRCSKDRFLRINPFTKELRAMHYYRSIKEIIVTGTTFMTIMFNDSSSPEYYQSVELQKILTTIRERSQPYIFNVSYQNEQ